MKTGNLDLTFNDCEILAYSYYQEGRNTIPEGAKKIYTANTLTIVASLLKIFLALSKTMMTIASSISLARVNLLKGNYKNAYDLNMKAHNALIQKRNEIKEYIKLESSQVVTLKKKRKELANKYIDIFRRLSEQIRIQKDIEKGLNEIEKMKQLYFQSKEEIVKVAKSSGFSENFERHFISLSYEIIREKIEESLRNDDYLLDVLDKNMDCIEQLGKQQSALKSEIRTINRARGELNRKLNQAHADHRKILVNLKKSHKICEDAKKELDKEDYKFKILDILTTQAYYE